MSRDAAGLNKAYDSLRASLTSRAWTLSISPGLSSSLTDERPGRMKRRKLAIPGKGGRKEEKAVVAGNILSRRARKDNEKIERGRS